MHPIYNRLPPPSDTERKRQARKLRKELFGHKKHYYDMDSIIKLFNQLSGYNNAPNPDKLTWGFCIATMQSVYTVMHKLGVKGTDIEQQVKQCVAAVLLVFDKDYSIVNKKLMDAILPHKDRTTRKDWLDKCVTRRMLLDIFDDSEYFCGKHQQHDRNSYVHS